MNKCAFLLADVPPIQVKPTLASYDKELELNTVERNGAAVPFVLNGADPTESKTYAYPGDDDPDPDDERCY